MGNIPGPSQDEGFPGEKEPSSKRLLRLSSKNENTRGVRFFSLSGSWSERFLSACNLVTI